jgi:replicative DNA helicase
MADPVFECAADVMTNWRDDVLSGKPPVFFPVGVGELSRVEIGPGTVTLLGGAPGGGKTALAMQWLVDALRLTPTLKALCCNVEMSPGVLLDRQLARLSGVDLTLIRHRRLGAEHAERIDQALCTLEPLAERLAFIRPPFNLNNVAATADAFEADFLLLDYIQRIPPPGDHADKRGAVNASMDYLRQFADAGTAVIVISAIGRTKDSSGRSSYSGDGLNLASFRESSELEFGADDAFILVPDDDQGDAITLRHLKTRHGEAKDIALTFFRKHQRFEAAGAGPGSKSGGGPKSASGEKKSPKPDPEKVKSALAALWARSRTAEDGEEAGGDGD